MSSTSNLLEQMTFQGLIQVHSRKLPRASGHPKTSQNIILSDPGPSGKNKNFDKTDENHEKTPKSLTENEHKKS